MKKIHSVSTLILFIAGASSLLFAGGAKETTSSTGASGVTKVRAAHTQTYVPYDFVNEKGESDGFEVAVLKAVDELLPDYEFEFVPTSDDDLLIGVETGKYDVGTKGAWYTEERARKYVIPKNPVAASIIGITFRSENKSQITDLQSFARFSGKLVPIAPQNAQWAIVEDYNRKNPDNQVKLVPSEAFAISDAYTWVLEGRYDAFFDIKLSYENNVVKENGPYHQLAARLAYVPYKGIPTYPLFNKNRQAFADAYDKAVAQLQADGTIARLSLQYFGENVFDYVTD